MDTVVDFFKPIVASTLPGADFFYGTLEQINVSLGKLPPGKGAVAMNNLLPFRMDVLNTGAQQFSHSVTMMFCIKSHPAWGPDKRNQAQRVALAWLRLMPEAIRAAGGKILGQANGAYFLNMFDVNLDGCSVGYQLELPDNWDYCIPELPTIPTI